MENLLPHIETLKLELTKQNFHKFAERMIALAE